jgi:hypothetical protein
MGEVEADLQIGRHRLTQKVAGPPVERVQRQRLAQQKLCFRSAAQVLQDQRLQIAGAGVFGV